MKCSYIEIYNDNVFDLLNPKNYGESLSIVEDMNDYEFKIRGVVEEPISSIDHILKKLQEGEKIRHYASTILNY